MKAFDKFFNEINEMISEFPLKRKKRKYTKRTFKVDDKDIITEFHPELLFIHEFKRNR